MRTYHYSSVLTYATNVVLPTLKDKLSDPTPVFNVGLFFETVPQNPNAIFNANGVFRSVAKAVRSLVNLYAQRDPHCPTEVKWELRDEIFSPEAYVEKTVYTSLSSAVYRACKLNTSIREACGSCFLNAQFKKNAEDGFFAADENALKLALEVADAYRAKFGKTILEAFYNFA